jgi:hypothetical protein
VSGLRRRLPVVSSPPSTLGEAGGDSVGLDLRNVRTSDASLDGLRAHRSLTAGATTTISTQRLSEEESSTWPSPRGRVRPSALILSG